MIDNEKAREATVHFAEPGAPVGIIDTSWSDSFVGAMACGSGGNNECMDTVAWADTPYGMLVVVCDGMGPHGVRAARAATNAIVMHLNAANAEADITDVLAEAFLDAHQAVRIMAERLTDNSGATIAALLINGNYATAAWLGDCRIYQLRGGTIIFRSTDHSKVTELVRAGVLSDEAARTSSQAHIVTRSLGRAKAHKPRMAKLSFLRGDRFAVCSDGIWRATEQKKLARALRRRPLPTDAIEQAMHNAVEFADTVDDMAIAIVEPLIKSTKKTRMRTSHKIFVAVLSLLLVASLTFNVLQYLGIVPDITTTTTAVTSKPEPAPAKAVVNASKQQPAKAVVAKADTTVVTPKPEPVVITGKGTPTERIEALEAVIASLAETNDKASREAIVDAATAEINALTTECADNAAAKQSLAKAADFLAVRKYTVNGNEADTRNQIGAINGQLRKARAALQ